MMVRPREHAHGSNCMRCREAPHTGEWRAFVGAAVQAEHGQCLVETRHVGRQIVASERLRPVAGIRQACKASGLTRNAKYRVVAP